MPTRRHPVRLFLAIVATAAGALAALSGGCPADSNSNPTLQPVVAGDSAVNDGDASGGANGGGSVNGASTSGSSTGGGGGAPAGQLNSIEIVAAGWMNQATQVALLPASQSAGDVTYSISGDPSPSGTAVIYANPGADVVLVYTPATDFVGDASITLHVSQDGAGQGDVVVRVRVLPEVRFALDRHDGETPAAVLASATAPSGYDLPEGVQLHWTFGDGSEATDAGTTMSRTHIYRNPGVYAVTLALVVSGVSGELGCMPVNPGSANFTARERSGDDPPTNQPPVAYAGPDQNVIDEDGNGFALVTLNGSGSSDADGQIIAYTWTVAGASQYGPGPSSQSVISLALGTWDITLSVMDDAGATATDSLRVVVGSAGTLGVSPGTELAAVGVVGGPFSPDSQVYTLTNSGDAPLTWSASAPATWIDISSSGGTLNAGASTNVTISVNSQANSFLVGNYGTTVTFANVHSGATTPRAVTLGVLPVGAMVVTPGGGLSPAGLVGGPFSPSSRSYTLTNTGSTAIAWTATKTRAWVTLSSAGGTLSGGGTAVVTVSINAQANALAAGDYSDTVSFTNSTNGAGNTTRSVALTVTAPAALTVSGTDLAASGPPGGPFSPASTTYTLQNTGGVSLNWTAGANQTWLTVSPTSGTLAAGASTTVTASINSNANALAAGSYGATVSVTNVTNGQGGSAREASLSVMVDTPAIAVWAFPDGVTLAGTAHLGLVAYHSTGIRLIEFRIDGIQTASVASETLNPETGELEFVLTLDTTLLTNGFHSVGSTAQPNGGIERVLPERSVFVANGLAFGTWYVDGAAGNDTTGTGSATAPFATIHRACLAANGGDIIRVNSGSYDIPDQSNYGFDKYTLITPSLGHFVTIRAITQANLSIRSSFLHFRGVTFDLNNDAAAKRSVISSAATHLWFENCDFVGWGHNRPDNNESALRIYSLARALVVERCVFRESATGVTATAGDVILRQNTLYDLTSDGISWDGEDFLATGNTIHSNKVPPGGTQHCDFWQSNSWGNFAVIRNNLAFDGDHQGQKFGGWSSGGYGRDGATYQEYSNIALVNNQMALGTGGSVNLRFEGIAKFKRFSNILIEHNTICAGSNSFIVETDVSASQLVVRNNIFWGASASYPNPIPNGIIFASNSWPTDPDPVFVDAASWDFRLQSGSPCVGHGVQGAVTYDRNWNPRSNPSDLGAFERP